MSSKRTVKPDKSYLDDMYTKKFVPGDIVCWWYVPDEGPRELNICKVVSIKMARYLYKIQIKSARTVDSVLLSHGRECPVFVFGPENPYDEQNVIGWMCEKDLFRFDKAAKVLYGSKETIDCARRLTRKR